jgi:4-amino-4-deoxy-L-arabinose transferase-like glycosyltransferase
MRLRIFVFFLAVFAATASGHIYTIDSALNYMVTRSMGRRGALDIDRFMMTVEGEEGRHYSKLGVGQSIAGLPLFWLGSLVEEASPGNPLFTAYGKRYSIPHGPGTPIDAEPQTLIRLSDREGAPLFFATLTNAFISAWVCLIFWLILVRFGASPARALAGAAVLGFATPLWIYARDFFGEPLFAACLLATFYLVSVDRSRLSHRGLVLAGLASSLGVLTRASFIPLIAVFAVYLLLNAGDRRLGARRAIVYMASCLPGILILAALNQARFGSVFLSGYHTVFDKGFSVPFYKGIAWNLVSPYRSIFLYAPPVFMGLVGLKTFARKHRAELLLAGAIVLYVFLLYSSWWAWHGGWCWGPRFLVPIIPLLLMPGFAGSCKGGRHWLGLALILFVAGFLVQVGAVLVNYTAAYDYWIKIGVLDWAEENIQMFSPITVHWKAISATSPAEYDLWLVQAFRVNPLAAAAVATGLGVLALITARGLLAKGTASESGLWP